jgi:drug/metabolite transporter (DMT)-like permease
MDALLPGGRPLHRPTIAGMLVGLAGAALLFLPGTGTTGIDSAVVRGFLVLQLGMAGWGFGSIYQRRHSGKAHPVISAAIQQLSAGLAVAPFALLIPEHPIRWSARGLLAMAYLIVFGSIIGYSAYIYALHRLPVAVVSIYPYVNAVVAVALGWVFYREPFGALEFVAMLIIFLGVWLVKRYAPGSAEQLQRAGEDACAG